MTEQTTTPAPVLHPIRPWTPDQLVYLPSGETGVRLSLKRSCHTCGEKVGDVTDGELRAVADVRNRRVPLLPITDECWKCRGFHALFAAPAARPETWRESDGDTWTVELLCPGKINGESWLRCATWQQCGCVLPSEPLTTEFQEFLDRPCPASPTGVHSYLPDKQYVGAPTGPCAFQELSNRPDGLTGPEAFITEPGLYAVQPSVQPGVPPEVFDRTPSEIKADLLAFEWIDLRQRDAIPAAG